MKEGNVNCVKCNLEIEKENIFQHTNLISYRCPNCGANVFDIVEVKSND